MKNRTLLLTLLFSILLLSFSCEEESSLNPADYEITIRMEGTYFIAWIENINDDTWTSENKGSFKVDGAAFDYSSANDYYYLDFNPASYSGGDVVTVDYNYDSLASKSIAITIPADLTGNPVSSPNEPTDGTENATSVYTFTPAAETTVDHFYFELRKFTSDDYTSDYDSRWRWYYFEQITTNTENFALKSGDVAPYFTLSVFGCEFVSDSSYYGDVDFWAVGRTGTRIGNITYPAGGVSPGIEMDINPRLYFEK